MRSPFLLAGCVLFFGLAASGTAIAASLPGLDCPFKGLSEMHRDIAGLALRDEVKNMGETAKVLVDAVDKCSAKYKWTPIQKNDAADHLDAQLRMHGAMIGLKETHVDMRAAEKIFAAITPLDRLAAAEDDDTFEEVLLDFLTGDIKHDPTEKEFFRNISAWLDAKLFFNAEAVYAKLDD